MYLYRDQAKILKYLHFVYEGTDNFIWSYSEYVLNIVRIAKVWYIVHTVEYSEPIYLIFYTCVHL